MSLYQQYRQTIEFEDRLKIGDICQARWTNCGYFYEAKVMVQKCNYHSYNVVLVEARPGYPKGRRLNIPNRFNFKRWSQNNRLAPLEKEGNG